MPSLFGRVIAFLTEGKAWGEHSSLYIFSLVDPDFLKRKLCFFVVNLIPEVCFFSNLIATFIVNNLCKNSESSDWIIYKFSVVKSYLYCPVMSKTTTVAPLHQPFSPQLYNSLLSSGIVNIFIIIFRG